MKNEFTSRLGMFNTVLTTLNAEAHKAVWFQQDPQIFTTKVTEAGLAVADLAEFCQKQSTVITGSAEEKAREVAEAEDAVNPMPAPLFNGSAIKRMKPARPRWIPRLRICAVCGIRNCWRNST